MAQYLKFRSRYGKTTVRAAVINSVTGYQKESRNLRAPGARSSRGNFVYCEARPCQASLGKFSLRFPGKIDIVILHSSLYARMSILLMFPLAYDASVRDKFRKATPGIFIPRNCALSSLDWLFLSRNENVLETKLRTAQQIIVQAYYMSRIRIAHLSTFFIVDHRRDKSNIY